MIDFDILITLNFIQHLYNCMVNVQSEHINESTFRILQYSAVSLEKENIKLIVIQEFKFFSLLSVFSLLHVLNGREIGVRFSTQ